MAQRASLNMTLLRGRLGLAFLLVLIVAALAVVMIFNAGVLSKEAVGLISGSAGALGTVMIFAVHSVYSAHAQAAEPEENPTAPGGTPAQQK